jgi:hypothetical protein
MYRTQAPPKVFPSLGASHIRERAIPNPRGRTFSCVEHNELSLQAHAPLLFHAAVTGGTASSDDLVNPGYQAYSIPIGSSETFISVPVKSDLIDEPDETIVVKTRRDKAPDAGEQFSVALFSPTVGWTAYGPGVVTLT